MDRLDHKDRAERTERLDHHRLERTPLKETTNILRSPIHLSGSEVVTSKPNKGARLQNNGLLHHNQYNSTGGGGSAGTFALTRSKRHLITNTNRNTNPGIVDNTTNTAAAIHDSHEAEEELRRWREQWRKIMRLSVVFFDGVDQQNVDKIRGHLSSLGTQIQPFFQRTVTHLVTKRSTNSDYGSADIISKARLLNMKVWSFEKLVRFLTHLLGVSPLEKAALSQPTANNLSKLLRQEKLIGPSDRDLNAPSDNFRVFKGPYLLVWDPTHCFRPTLFKEFSKAPTDAEGDWPQFRLTPSGQCPFIYIPPDHVRELERRSYERKRKLAIQLKEEEEEEEEFEEIFNAEEDEFQAEEESEEDLALNKYGNENKNVATDHEHGDGYEKTNGIFHHETITSANNMPATKKLIVETHHNHHQQQRPSTLIGQNQPYNTANRFYELAASGINRSTMTSATRSVAQSGGGQSGTSTITGANGLAATVAQVPSRELANLQRKVLTRPMIKQDDSNTLGSTNFGSGISSRAGIPVRPSVASKADVEATAEAAVAAAAAAAIHKRKSVQALTAVASATAGSKPTESKSHAQEKKKFGFCENCQEQFESFEAHVQSKRHVKFATDDRHFEALDKLLNDLSRPLLR